MLEFKSKTLHTAIHPSHVPQIYDHPRLHRLLLSLGDGAHECRTYLGMFGARTWKPVRLVSSAECVSGLIRTCCDETPQRFVETHHV